MSALLPLLVAVPMLVGGAMVAVSWPHRVRATILVVVLALDVAACTALLVRTAHGDVVVNRVAGWSPSLAIPFVADAFSALMLLLTAAFTLLVCAFAIATRADTNAHFVPLVLLVASGVNGALLTGDLFNLFVFIEIMLVPSYGLLILASKGEGKRMQVTATRIYVTVNLLTSSVFLVGVALIYAGLGTVNMAELAGRGAETRTGLLGCLILLFALCVKAAVVPMHGWLGRTYPFMSPTVTALFSGLHTKVAVYAIFRLLTLLFGETRFVWVGTTIFCISMVVGVLAALGQKDSRAVLSFHMVSQIGYVLLGVALMTGAGIAAGVFYLLHNVIAKGSLFLSVGAVEYRYGRHPIGDIKGLMAREPLVSTTFLVAALALAGLPPLSGFVAKLAIITAAMQDHQWWAAGVALGVSLFTLMSMLKIWSGSFLGEPDPPMAEHEGPRIRLIEIAPAMVLAAATVVLGLWAQPLLSVCDVIGTSLQDPTSYVAAVTR